MTPAINKEVERGAAIKQTDLNIPKPLILLFLALATLFFIDGCIPYYIPTNEHGFESQEAVTKDMVKQLEPGTTTKNDVELLFENIDRLGDRPAQMSGDSVYCYYWRRKDGLYGYIALWDYSTASDVHKSTEILRAFCLEFMPDDKLKRFKHFESGEAEPIRAYEAVYQQIEDWENEED